MTTGAAKFTFSISSVLYTTKAKCVALFKMYHARTHKHGASLTSSWRHVKLQDVNSKLTDIVASLHLVASVSEPWCRARRLAVTLSWRA